MRRIVVLMALVTVGTWSMATLQGAPEKLVRGIQKVRDNLYFISGGDIYEVGRGSYTGGNSAVFVTDAGVVVIDTMNRGNGAGILEQIRSVTKKPVTMILHTHTHGDHTGSDTEFPMPVELVTQENIAAQLSQETCAPVTNCDAFKGANAQYLPKRTFKDRMTIGSGKDQIDLYYFGRGHTNGDTFVVFPAVRAMHAGDMFQQKNMPFVDTANGYGSASEFAATLTKALNGIQNVDYVIGGHTPTVYTWPDFKDFVDFYNDFYTRVKDGQQAGKTAAQVASDYRVPARYNGYFADPGRVKDNAQAIFDGE